MLATLHVGATLHGKLSALWQRHWLLVQVTANDKVVFVPQTLEQAFSERLTLKEKVSLLQQAALGAVSDPIKQLEVALWAGHVRLNCKKYRY